MRIIAGEKRGFRLLGPPEVEMPNLKPLPDKVRESVFNILGQQLAGEKVLDLYAGTGAVGLEALSRGAGSATFVEIDKKIADLIKKNIEKLGYAEEVYAGGAASFLAQANEKYDLIFITPPHREINFNIVENAEEKLTKDGIIILESDAKEIIPPINNLKVIDQRNYGRLKITFLQCV